MNERFLSRLACAALAAAAGIAVPDRAFAVDGQVLIDHAKALAGGVTSGDAAGYPVRIGTPGSYKLSGNLRVPDANTTAIEIAADNVTLDLNGFAILGATNCNGGFPCANAGSGSGIVTPATQRNISIRNGAVEGMGHTGMRLKGGSHLVEAVHVSSNGYAGIHLEAVSANELGSSIVQHSSARRNAGAGIRIYRGIVRHCTADGNRDYGIYVQSGLAAYNTASRNKIGMVVQEGGGYLGNVIRDNPEGDIRGYGKGLGHNLSGVGVH